MKYYEEINTIVHGYPTVRDMLNPDVFGNIDCLVYLSPEPLDKDVREIIEMRSIEYLHYKLTEKKRCSWDMVYEQLIPKLIIMYKKKCLIGICCRYGQRMSRALAESLYYRVTGKWYTDFFRDNGNHMLYFHGRGNLSSKVMNQQRLYMYPDYDGTLFRSESGACIGDLKSIHLTGIIKDEDIDLSSVEGLSQWLADWIEECVRLKWNWDHDGWLEWWNRGLSCACQIKRLLPPHWRLYYTHDISTLDKQDCDRPDLLVRYIPGEDFVEVLDERNFKNNYLHQKNESYEEQLSGYINWKESFIPRYDLPVEDNELQQWKNQFRNYWLREELDAVWN